MRNGVGRLGLVRHQFNFVGLLYMIICERRRRRNSITWQVVDRRPWQRVLRCLQPIQHDCMTMRVTPLKCTITIDHSYHGGFVGGRLPMGGPTPREPTYSGTRPTSRTCWESLKWLLCSTAYLCNSVKQFSQTTLLKKQKTNRLLSFSCWKWKTGSVSVTVAKANFQYLYSYHSTAQPRADVVALRIQRQTIDRQVASSTPAPALLRNNLRQPVRTIVPLSSTSISWYRYTTGMVAAGCGRGVVYRP